MQYSPHSPRLGAFLGLSTTVRYAPWQTVSESDPRAPRWEVNTGVTRLRRSPARRSGRLHAGRHLPSTTTGSCSTLRRRTRRADATRTTGGSLGTHRGSPACVNAAASPGSPSGATTQPAPDDPSGTCSRPLPGISPRCDRIPDDSHLVGAWHPERLGQLERHLVEVGTVVRLAEREIEWAEPGHRGRCHHPRRAPPIGA